MNWDLRRGIVAAIPACFQFIHVLQKHPSNICKWYNQAPLKKQRNHYILI